MFKKKPIVNLKHILLRVTSRTILLVVIPILIIGLQAIYTLQSTGQIRMEEFAESIRNVYWFNREALYNYLSHHIGWYATVDLANKLFGFSLFTAKLLKLIIFYISSTAVVWLALRFFKNWKIALVVSLSYLLSPTLLYFNTQQALFGTDLLYVPILLVLAIKSWEETTAWKYLNALLFGLLLMISYFTYAVFYFSIPFMIFIFFYKGYLVEKNKTDDLKILFKQIGLRTIMVIVGICLVILDFKKIIVDFRMLDFYLFLAKQGGQTYPHTPNMTDFLINLRHLFQDLFIKGSSYHYELLYPDFSLVVPVVAVLIAIGMLIVYRKMCVKIYPYLAVAGLMVLYNIIIIQYRNGPITDSGIRRSTPIILLFYFLYSLGWYIYSKNQHNHKKPYVVLVLLLLLPLHHIAVYIPNINSISQPSKFAYNIQFSAPGSSNVNPQQFIKDKVTDLEINSLYLKCDNLPQTGRYDMCRYPELYAALKLGCYYWHKECKSIYGYDHKTQTMIEIKGALWDTEYWPL